jgi:hypothetical protein
MTFRLLLVVLVFALDLWALFRVLGEPLGWRQRWKWALLIVLLPVAGVILWQRDSRRRAALEARLAAVARQ